MRHVYIYDYGQNQWYNSCTQDFSLPFSNSKIYLLPNNNTHCLEYFFFSCHNFSTANKYCVETIMTVINIRVLYSERHNNTSARKWGN